MNPPEAKDLEEFSLPYPDKIDPDILIQNIESMNLGWSLDHTHIIEARVWFNFHVIGRYRPRTTEPLSKMLWQALSNAHHNILQGTTNYA